MTIEGRGLDNQKVRERLSYRALDVESIGSVYETVMGFTTRRASERMIALRDEKKLPNFIGLDTLLAQKPADRQKWLKDQSIKLSAKQAAALKDAADVDALIAALGNGVDERASPGGTAIGRGTPYLQPTDERRRSGSHYTPRSLTEPIVRHALEPAFGRIGADASPEAVLALKVLDPACGSGAFLVEACRQLGARLEQAWDMHKAEKPAIPSDEDETIHARRLVAQRCLYGVDRNPMAVDLARLSLWLATLAREHEFTFLDHAIKSGDSLVGLTIPQIAAAHWDEQRGINYLGDFVRREVDRALLGREAIRNAPDDVSRAIQEARHVRVEAEVEAARQLGDAVVAAFFSEDKPKAREAARAKVEELVLAPVRPDWEKISSASRQFRTEQGWRPFHWELEFPEVFARDNPGFDAIVGNPPFAGKNTISAGSGPRYLPWLQQLHEGAHGNADLVAHFFRRAFNLLRQGGAFGLIATNTIGQGDTRQTGLTVILEAEGEIYRAIKRLQWPNEGAAVIVSVVHILKGATGKVELDGRKVERISAYLVDGALDVSPARLSAARNLAGSGFYILGMGFTFDDSAKPGEASTLAVREALLATHPANAEVIRPYLGGEEINGSPSHAFRRYVIDFGERSEAECRVSFPELMKIVEDKVKPARDKYNRDTYRKNWWRFAERRPMLARGAERLTTMVAASRVSPHLAMTFIDSNIVASEATVIFLFEKRSPYAVLQSRVHEIWARFFSSSMKDDLRYAPSDCFETFPFPPGYETDAALEAIGQAYHDHRAELMVAADEGMTKTYNRFHKPTEMSAPIQRLRELHDEMDRAVLRAYGWHDLADTLRPEFLTEDTEDDYTYQGRYFWPAPQRDLVISRLLALNRERYAEEVRQGLHDKSKKRIHDEDDDESEFTLGGEE